MAEINAAIPMSYQFGSTIGQHFENAVKLADMMEQRKERALDMEAKRQTMAQQAAMNPLQVQQAQQNLQQSAESFPVEMDTKKAALQAYLDKHKEDVQKFDSAQMALDAKIAADVVDQQSFDVWREFRKGLGLDPNQFGNVYNPDIQPHIDAISTAYKAKEPDQFGKTPTGLDLKYAKDPEYVSEQEKILKSFLDNGKIDKSSFNALSGVVKTRPVSWQSQLPQFLSLKESGQKLDNAKTAEELEKLRLEKEAKEKENAQVAATIAAAKNERETIKTAIDEIANSPAFATGFDPKRLMQAIVGTPEFDWLQKVENLKSKLALNERQKLKGQGQISDKESEMLNKAVSMLNTNLSATAFKTELARLKDVIADMDKNAPAVGGGQTGKTTKKVWNEQTGKFEVQ